MTEDKPIILRVALPVPIPGVECLDYLPPLNVSLAQLQRGVRLQVPLKDRIYIGLLWEITTSSEINLAKLKRAITVLDKTPLLTEAELNLLAWASHYYYHPLGEVIATALPPLLTNSKKPAITELLVDQPATVMQPIQPPLTLNSAQIQVVQQVCKHLDQFYPNLLEGITGSGKTEVYLQIIEQVLKRKRQALVLVPEINLTPQMLERFQQRFSVPIVALHSKLRPTERLQNWQFARAGLAPIVIGTRSAVWVPLARPGIFIVDEEHDPSYKQQDSFGYSARDVAVMRAQQAQVPVMLGSATPSLDSLYNVQEHRYFHFTLPERAGNAVHPCFQFVDMRQQNYKNAISQPLKNAIEQCLSNQQQALIFINRRGYAPTFMCYQCAWIATCQHCDSHLVYHESYQKLICHHCGSSRLVDKICPHCGHPKLSPLGQGTQRVEKQIQKLFPTARVIRIDSDTTQRKQALQSFLTAIHAGEADILIGTQILAKGHHFPKVTLVGIVNIDASLFGADFRSSERAAQMLIQVAGRAGRAENHGQVIIQTYHPQHPLLLHLIKEGYPAFAEAALAERRQAQFPPYSYFALLRAEAKTPNLALEFLQQAKDQTPLFATTVTFWGPVPAPLERRAQFYRAQLLLQANRRSELHAFLNQWLPSLQSIATHKIYYSLDIDPQDLS